MEDAHKGLCYPLPDVSHVMRGRVGEWGVYCFSKWQLLNDGVFGGLA